MNINRREFLTKTAVAGVALTEGASLFKNVSAAELPSFDLPKYPGEGSRWSPSLKDKPTAAKPAFWLVQNGQPKATIIIAHNALDTNQQAAQLLQEYVEKISGAKLPISDDTKSVEGAKVLIGRSKPVDALNLDLPSGFTSQLKEEGYVIQQIGDSLVLAGNDHRPTPAYQGSLFAVVEILQGLGCRWYFPGEFGEIFPLSKDISLPHLDERVKPSLAVHGMTSSIARKWSKDKSVMASLAKYRMLNRLLPYGEVLPSASVGSIMKPFKSKQMFEEHPEYYALNKDGTRNPKYLDLSNPDVLDVTTQYAFTHFDTHPESTFYAIAPPPGSAASEDPQTLALNKYFTGKFPIDSDDQDISGSFYWFLNKFAQRVKEKYPDKWVATTAYAGCVRPPEFELCDNITVRFMLMAHSRHHRYDWVTWQVQDRIQLYKRWVALLDKVVERPFPATYFSCNVPQIMYRAEIYNTRMVKELGMRGREWEGRAAFFTASLTNYVRGQLLWNTETDAEALLEDYYVRFYDNAAKTVRAFDERAEELLTQCLIDHHEEERLHEIYPHSEVVLMTDKVGDVEKLVADGDAKTKQRVFIFRKMVDHFRDYSEMRYAEAQGDFKKAAQKAQHMIDIENEMDEINPFLIDGGAEQFDQNIKLYGELGANASAHGKLRQYNAKAKLMDGTDGTLAAILPETWLFKTDPHNKGVYYQWHQTPLDKSWKPIKTTSCWEVQGFQDEEAHGYNGFAWYRVEFDLPANMAGKKLMLFIGGMNDQAWIWVNYKLAAGTPCHKYYERWKYHSEVDITEYAIANKTNSLAIRIYNEQDAGGLFRRSFIYSPNLI